jgi:CBS domain-containing protein
MRIMSASENSIYTIDVQETLLSAVSKIEQNKLKCVFVVNSDKQLVGVLADGDIRRQILSGLSMSVSVREVCNRGVKYIVIKSDVDFRVECYEVFLKHRDVNVIPIVDTRMKILSVVCREVAEDMGRMNES